MTGPTPPTMTPAEWTSLGRELPVNHWLQPRITAWRQSRALWTRDGQARKLDESWGDTTVTPDTTSERKHDG